MSTSYAFDRRGRTPRTGLALALAWAGLAVLALHFDAAPWLIALLAVPTLPAAMDLLRDPVWSLRLTDRALIWQMPGHETSIPLDQIETVRLDTAWDFSVRATVQLRDGPPQRLPPACMPPHRDFEAALLAAGLRTERHHFTRR